MNQTNAESNSVADELAKLRAENEQLKAQLTAKRRQRTVRTLLLYTTLAAVFVATFVFVGKRVRSVGYHSYRESGDIGAHIEVDGLIEWYFLKLKGKEYGYFGPPRTKPVMKSK